MATWVAATFSNCRFGFKCGGAGCLKCGGAEKGSNVRQFGVDFFVANLSSSFDIVSFDNGLSEEEEEEAILFSSFALKNVEFEL